MPYPPGLSRDTGMEIETTVSLVRSAADQELGDPASPTALRPR
jgi:hypothetical protein